jgi:hypothetical protein
MYRQFNEPFFAVYPLHARHARVAGRALALVLVYADPPNKAAALAFCKPRLQYEGYSFVFRELFNHVFALSTYISLIKGSIKIMTHITRIIFPSTGIPFINSMPLSM